MPNSCTGKYIRKLKNAYIFRGALRTISNIYDEAFCEKKLAAENKMFRDHLFGTLRISFRKNNI